MGNGETGNGEMGNGEMGNGKMETAKWTVTLGESISSCSQGLDQWSSQFDIGPLLCPGGLLE